MGGKIIYVFSFKDYLKILALNVMHQHPIDIRARKAYLSYPGVGQLLAQQVQ